MQRIVIIAWFIGLCNVTSILAVIKSTTTTGTFPRLLLSDFFDEDTDSVRSPQIYGSCLGKFYGNESSCPLTLAPRRPTDTPNRSFTCDFQVPVPDETSQCNPAYRRAATISKVKALLVLSQGCTHSFYILNFSNCRATPVKYNNKTSIRACTWGFFIQVPPGLYDVIMDGASRVMFRRVLVYEDDEVYPDLTDWQSYNMKFQNKAFFYSLTRGRLFTELEINLDNNHMFTVLTVNDDGSNRTVKEYLFHHYSKRRTSAMNEFLSICIQMNTTIITCTQFNPDGDVMFEIPALQYDNKYTTKNVTLIGIHNLPGGGLNLMTADDEVAAGKYIVTKIDRKGKIVGSLKIPSFHCEPPLYIHFFNNDKTGEQCFSQLCASEDEYKRIKLQTICFDEQDYFYKNINN